MGRRRDTRSSNGRDPQACGKTAQVGRTGCGRYALRKRSAGGSTPVALPFEWKIDKRIPRYGRICESTGTSDYDEAEKYLARKLEEIRAATVYGVRPKRTFREAATKFLNDHTRRRGISRDATALKDLDPHIGDKFIDEIYDGTFKLTSSARIAKRKVYRSGVWTATSGLLLGCWRRPHGSGVMIRRISRG